MEDESTAYIIPNHMLLKIASELPRNFKYKLNQHFCYNICPFFSLILSHLIVLYTSAYYAALHISHKLDCSEQGWAEYSQYFFVFLAELYSFESFETKIFFFSSNIDEMSHYDQLNQNEQRFQIYLLNIERCRAYQPVVTLFLLWSNKI